MKSPPAPPKPSTTLRLMMGILVLGVVSYLGFYILAFWQNDLHTTTAYLYTVDEGIQAQGVVIREEQILQGGQSYFIDLLPAEGERVGKGQPVALLHQDGQGTATRQRIRTLESEIYELEYTLASGTMGADVTRLDADVLDSMVQLRSMAARKDLSSLEEAALELRTRIFKRENTVAQQGEATSTAALIAARKEELLRLEASLSHASQTIPAPQAGTFSGVTDGFEHVLTPEVLSSLTADRLDELLQQPQPLPNHTIGRLITSSTWYFAARIPIQQATGLVEGRTYSIAFSNDYFGRVDMKLTRLHLPQQGNALAVFAGRTNLSNITALRRQTVDIVIRQVEGIRIPGRALRVRQEEQTEDGGLQTIQVERTGVYTVVGTRAEWQPVEVLYSGAGFYLVAPSHPNAARRLRAGDEVILSSHVFDKKVVR